MCGLCTGTVERIVNWLIELALTHPPTTWYILNGAIASKIEGLGSDLQEYFDKRNFSNGQKCF
jgi:hypothetical protein